MTTDPSSMSDLAIGTRPESFSTTACLSVSIAAPSAKCFIGVTSGSNCSLLVTFTRQDASHPELFGLFFYLPLLQILQLRNFGFISEHTITSPFVDL
jgi:hypothetical protein